MLSSPQHVDRRKSC